MTTHETTSLSQTATSPFLTLHEIVKKARQKLSHDNWDYIIGGTETETTVRRNRAALDAMAACMKAKRWPGPGGDREDAEHWLGDHAEYIREGPFDDVVAQLEALVAQPYRPVTPAEIAWVKETFSWERMATRFWAAVSR